VASVRRALLTTTTAVLFAALPARAVAPAEAASAVRQVESSAQPGRSTARRPAAFAPSGQTPTVKLTAGFSPERLGAGTTVRLGFQITEPAGAIPPALTELGVLYPAELGIATSDLGLEECSMEILRQDGVGGCPPNSLMGRGSAEIDVPFLLGPVREPVSITLFSGPVQEGHLGLLFFANGEAPVIAKLPFAGVLLPAQGQFGGLLSAQIPLVLAVPEGPAAAILSMRTTIGPRHLTYYRRIRHRLVGFHPRGILLPSNCPRGGFPFTAHLSFQNGVHVEARTTVPCPRRR
jgi:hypothetical protein